MHISKYTHVLQYSRVSINLLFVKPYVTIETKGTNALARHDDVTAGVGNDCDAHLRQLGHLYVPHQHTKLHEGGLIFRPERGEALFSETTCKFVALHHSMSVDKNIKKGTPPPKKKKKKKTKKKKEKRKKKHWNINNYKNESKRFR